MSGEHSGHRQRLRDIYFANGVEGMTDTDLMEFYLTLIIPRYDVRPIAMELIKSFGDIGGVFSASYDELLNVTGVGKNTASIICTSAKLIDISENNVKNPMNTYDGVKDFLSFVRQYFISNGDSKLVVVYLDNSYNIIRLNNFPFEKFLDNMGNIIEGASGLNASMIAFARTENKSNNIFESKDVNVIVEMKHILEVMNIKIFDYYIVSKNDCFILSKSNDSNLLKYSSK